MTETNKKRVVKYLAIVEGCDLVHAEKYLDVYSKFPKCVTAINCAIAEVEAVIEAIGWHEFETPNKELEFYHSELAELKSMLQ